MVRWCACIGLWFAGCGLPSMVASKPARGSVDDAVVANWAEQIRLRGEPGDWLLTRNYALAGDVIAALSTGSESLSHAGLYDKERDVVIEATSPRVQEVPLENFIRRYRRVVLVRPRELSRGRLVRSVTVGRSTIGTDYDWGGLIGLNSPDRFYCSEFVLDVAYSPPEIDRPVVVTPAALLDFSDVVYDGGVRDAEETRKRVNESQPLGVHDVAMLVRRGRPQSW